MSLHEKVVSLERHHNIKLLDNQISEGYCILDKLKDACKGDSPLAKEVRNKIAELNKTRAELWLDMNKEKVDRFLGHTTNPD